MYVRGKPGFQQKQNAVPKGGPFWVESVITRGCPKPTFGNQLMNDFLGPCAHKLRLENERKIILKW